MGKKSRRNKKNNGGPLRKGLAAVSTAAAPAAATSSTNNIYETICRLMDADKYDEILKVESKLRHLDSFSNDPGEDVYILNAFGRAHYDCSAKDEICLENRAIEYFERSKERMEDVDAGDRHEVKETTKIAIGFSLALLYSDGRDMEKAISSHRWFLVNCSSLVKEATADYVIKLSDDFNRFGKFEYTIEVLEGSMDMVETFDEAGQAESNLIHAYIGCGEFLKAKAANEKRRSTDKNHCLAMSQSGRIELGLCNDEAAIAHFRKAVAGLQKQTDDDSLGRTRFDCSVGLAPTLLRHSADNEDEAFAIFQEELDRCVNQVDRTMINLEMSMEYRKVDKWDQSIEALHRLYLNTLRPDGSTLYLVDEGMAQTYLEQYCTDTTLDIDQRTEILCKAKMSSLRVHFISTEMHLIFAQLFYVNGDKRQAYYHLELYLDGRLAQCKLKCYTCEQRVRHGSVPFSCASCRVASYCGRKHQKLTWKNERICHKVLCPLFGYWRMAKKKQKTHKGLQLTNEDQCEYERVFDTFFESICPHGLIIVDGNLQKADSTDLLKSRQGAAQIVKEAKEKQLVLLGEDALLK